LTSQDFSRLFPTSPDFSRLLQTFIAQVQIAVH
jgi:hypothetical protein